MSAQLVRSQLPDQKVLAGRGRRTRLSCAGSIRTQLILSWRKANSNKVSIDSCQKFQQPNQQQQQPQICKYGEEESQEAHTSRSSRAAACSWQRACQGWQTRRQNTQIYGHSHWRIRCWTFSVPAGQGREVDDGACHCDEAEGAKEQQTARLRFHGWTSRRITSASLQSQ